MKNSFKFKGYTDGMNFAIDNYSAAILLCLKDKFDFTTEQLQEVTFYINDMFDSICRGYLSLDDIMKTLKEENDIELQFNSKNPFIKPDYQPMLLQDIPEQAKIYKEFQNKYLSQFVTDGEQKDGFISNRPTSSEEIRTDEVYKELERKFKKEMDNVINTMRTQEQKINKPIFDPLSHSTAMLLNKISISDGSKEDLERVFREVGLDE